MPNPEQNKWEEELSDLLYPFIHSDMAEDKKIIRNIKKFVSSLLFQTRQEAIEEMIKLSDEIEMREPDGGTKQWMAFKAFRNKMRDRIKERLK